jgi:hypothetical protein
MSDPAATPARLWSAVLVGAAVLLGVAGVRGNFRGESARGSPSDAPLPALAEPVGELPEPPGVFRWTPSGPEVGLSQVTVFRGNLEPWWYSAPLDTCVIEVDPAEVFAGIPAGETVFWRVREVTDGRPRATSALVQFSFALDAQGRGPGEAPPEEPLLPQE